MENDSNDKAPGVEVEAYAGYKAGETPRKVIINGKEFPVEYIVFRSREYDKQTKKATENFKLKLEDYGECEIVYDTKWDRWELKNKPEKTFVEIWNEAFREEMGL